MPLQAALLDFTNLNVRFVGDRKFDGNSPIWTAYLAGLGREIDFAIGRIAFTVTAAPGSARISCRDVRMFLVRD